MPMPSGGDGMDEATLERIADITGGRAFRARDTAELAGIYAEIDRLEPVQRPGESVRPRLERYPWPLAMALLCWLLGFLLPRGVRLPLRTRGVRNRSQTGVCRRSRRRSKRFASRHRTSNSRKPSHQVL